MDVGRNGGRRGPAKSIASSALRGDQDGEGQEGPRVPRVVVSLERLNEVVNAIGKLKQAGRFRRERVLAFINGQPLDLGDVPPGPPVNEHARHPHTKESSRDTPTKFKDGSDAMRTREGGAETKTQPGSKPHTEGGHREKRALATRTTYGADDSGGEGTSRGTGRRESEEHGDRRGKGPAEGTAGRAAGQVQRSARQPREDLSEYAREPKGGETLGERGEVKKLWQPGDPFIKVANTDPDNVMRDSLIGLAGSPKRGGRGRERRREHSESREPREPLEYGERSRDWGYHPDYTEDRHQGMGGRQMYSDRDEEYREEGGQRRLWEPSEAFTRPNTRPGEALLPTPPQQQQQHQQRQQQHRHGQGYQNEPQQRRGNESHSGASDAGLRNRVGSSEGVRTSGDTGGREVGAGGRNATLGGGGRVRRESEMSGGNGRGEFEEEEEEEEEEQEEEEESEEEDEEEDTREYDPRRRRAPKHGSRRDEGQEGEEEEDSYESEEESQEEGGQTSDSEEEHEERGGTGREGGRGEEGGRPGMGHTHTQEEEAARREARNQCHMAVGLCKKLGEMQKKLQASNTQGIVALKIMATEVFQMFGAAVVADISYVHAKDIEQTMWRDAFYQTIEVYRRSLRQIQAAIAAKQKEADAIALSSGWDENIQQRYEEAISSGNRLIEFVREEFEGFLYTGIAFHQWLINQLQIKHRFRLAVSEEKDHSGSGFSDNLWLSVRRAQPASSERHVKLATLTCHRCFISMGDLERYRQANHESEDRDWSTAARYYWCARTLAPRNAKPYNQLAVLASYREQLFYAVYFYMRSLAVKHPFLTARDSLTLIFDKVRTQAKGLANAMAASLQENTNRDGGKDTSAQVQGSTGTQRSGVVGTREVWTLADRRVVCQDGVVVSVETTGADTDADNEFDSNVRLADLGGAEAVMWRFTTHVLHVHSMFFSKIGLEVLPDNQAALLEEMGMLLKEMCLSPGLLVQLVAMAICSVHDQPHALDPTQVSVIQRAAVIFSAHIFSLLAQMCVRCLNDPENGEAEMHLEIILPAVKVYCDWLRCGTGCSMWMPVLLDARNLDSCAGRFWSSLVALLNAVQQLISSARAASTALPRVALWEDRVVSGLAHLSQVHADLIFDPPVSTPTNQSNGLHGDAVSQQSENTYAGSAMNEHEMRARSIREFGDWLVCELEKFAQVPRLEGEAKVAAYAQGGFRRYGWTEKGPWVEGVVSVSKDDGQVRTFVSRPRKVGERGARAVEVEPLEMTESDEAGQLDAAGGEESQSEGDGGSIDRHLADLRSRMTELAAALDMQKRQTEVVEAALAKQKRLVGLQVEVTPAFVIFDTNCFVSYLSVIQRLVETHRHVVVCPLVVVNELYGLKKGQLARQGADPIHIAAVKAMAQEAVQYLEAQFARSNQHLRAMTARGTMLTSIKFRTEAELSEARSNDDIILGCCLHLVDSKQDATRLGKGEPIRRRVVLVTDDINLRVRAHTHHIPVRDLVAFTSLMGLS